MNQNDARFSDEEKLATANDNSNDSPDVSGSRETEEASQTARATKKTTARPWLCIVGCFFIFFNIWGLTLSFGAFEAFYRQSLLHTSSESSISWIGTIGGFLLLVVGVVTGPIHDWGYFRSLTISGSLLLVFATMMLSVCDSYYQVFLAQGLGIGLASGLLYIPSLAVVLQSFERYRAVAVGLVTSGGSVGGVVYPVMFRALQPKIGFAWTVRCMGFLALATTVPIFLTTIRYPPKHTGRARGLFDLAAVKDLPFLAFCASGFFVLIAYYIPFVYVPLVSEDLGASPDLAFYLLSIMNGASFFGRLTPGWVADKIGAIYILIMAQTSAAVVLFAWLGVKSIPGLIVWTIVWGFLSGLLVSLPAAVVPSLCPNANVIGARLGMAWMSSAFGLLIGGPIGGALLKGSGVKSLQILTGAAMLGGALFCTVPLVSLARRK